jgi:hypothetical protein
MAWVPLTRYSTYFGALRGFAKIKSPALLRRTVVDCEPDGFRLFVTSGAENA